LPQRRAKFEQAVLPHMDAAYNLARWLTRNDQDARDVVQDAALRAFRFLDGLRGEPKPWFLTLVRNAGMDWLKANRPAELTAMDPAAPELQRIEEQTPETLALRAVDRRTLNEALAALPAQFREALILRELEDLAYTDIARITGTPIGTVMSRLSRARRLLAASLQAITRASARKVHE
jgi:RNA polymerase sigma-70 factor (ECF subfamily)